MVHPRSRLRSGSLPHFSHGDHAAKKQMENLEGDSVLSLWVGICTTYRSVKFVIRT